MNYTNLTNVDFKVVQNRKAKFLLLLNLSENLLFCLNEIYNYFMIKFEKKTDLEMFGHIAPNLIFFSVECKMKESLL